MPTYKIERLPHPRQEHYYGLEKRFYKIIVKLPITGMELIRKIITVTTDYIARKPNSIFMFPDKKYRLRTFMDKFVVDDNEFVTYDKDALEKNKKDFIFQVKNVNLYAH